MTPSPSHDTSGRWSTQLRRTKEGEGKEEWEEEEEGVEEEGVEEEGVEEEEGEGEEEEDQIQCTHMLAMTQ